MTAWPILGRDAERSELESLLDGPARFVCIVGPPGVGKTTLARDVGSTRGGRYCDVTDVTSADSLVARVCDALGIVVGAKQRESHPEALAELLRTPALLVLDGLERIVDVIRPLLPTWLTNTQLRILATSRRRVGLGSGETVFELGPLTIESETKAPSPALELFLHHARRARRGFGKSARERDEAHDLVRRLDGLPLAIELAATRMSVISPREMLERIDGTSLSSLAEDARRVALLDDAIEQSWTLLSTFEKSALAQCSVFRGSFDVRAAEGTLRLHRAAPPIFDVLQQLRNHSLLRTVDGKGGLRVEMHLAIRDFAGRKLEPKGKTQLARDRHAAYFAQIELLSDARDAENAFAALEHARTSRKATQVVQIAAAMEDFAVEHGPLGPILNALDETIDQASAAFPRATLLLAHELRGTVHGTLGRLRESLADDEDAVRLATALGDDDALARGLLREAALHVFFADERRARECIDGAMRIAGVLRSREHEQAALTWAGLLDLMGGDSQPAFERLSRALEIAHRRRDRIGEARVLAYLGLLEHDRADFDEAERLYGRALATFEDKKSRLAAYVVGYQGMLAHEKLDLDAARASYEAALDVISAFGDRRAETWLLASLGALDAFEGDIATASTRIAEADRIAQSTGDFNALALARYFKLAVLAAKAERGDSAALEAAMLLRDEATTGKRSPASRSWDVRFVLRIFARMRQSNDPTKATTIAADGSWFCGPDGKRVGVRKYRAAVLMLRALAANHRRAPGTPTSLEDLLVAGWPGERVGTLAGVNRVHVTLNRLRRLGLREVLVRTEGGYALRAHATIAINSD